MSHLYPLASTGADALKSAEHAALSRSAAQRLAGEQRVVGLETDWLTLTEDEAETALRLAETEAYPGVGFIQRYEDASGTVVLAVTYWKLAGQAQEETGAKTDAARAQTSPDVAGEHSAPEEDHTDDLYFRAGRTKKRGRTKKVDPNQLDLFGQAKDP